MKLPDSTLPTREEDKTEQEVNRERENTEEPNESQEELLLETELQTVLKEKGDSNTPKHQKLITSYFASQESQLECSEVPKNNPIEEDGNKKDGDTSEIAKGNQPTYLCVAKRAMEKEQKESRATSSQ